MARIYCIQIEEVELCANVGIKKSLGLGTALQRHLFRPGGELERHLLLVRGWMTQRRP